MQSEMTGKSGHKRKGTGTAKSGKKTRLSLAATSSPLQPSTSSAKRNLNSELSLSSAAAKVSKDIVVARFKRGQVKDLSEGEINCLLHDSDDEMSDDGSSEKHEETSKSQKIKVKQVEPFFKIQDLIKVQTFSSSPSVSSEANEKSSTPSKTTKSQDCATPKRKGRVPKVATPKSQPPKAAATPKSKVVKAKGKTGTPARRSLAVDSKRFSCTVCPETFRNQHALDDHMEDDHDHYEPSPELSPTPDRKKRATGR